MPKLVGLLFSLLLLAGCGAGTFQLPKQEYQEKVQVLGVVPLLLDRAAPLSYPQREGLYDLVLRNNAGKHEALVAQLKNKKGYFDVRSLAGNADLLATSLLAGAQPVDAAGRPNGFSFNVASVRELAERNVVDALLVVVFAGARIEETRRSRTLLESLQTGYSDLVATAAVIGRDGRILWQLAGEESYRALALQYADFDEAYYNHTDAVRLKYIELAGLEFAFSRVAGADDRAPLPKLYSELFERISKGLSPGLLDVL